MCKSKHLIYPFKNVRIGSWEAEYLRKVNLLKRDFTLLELQLIFQGQRFVLQHNFQCVG